MRIYSIWAEHIEKLEADKWQVERGKWGKVGKVLQEFKFIGGSNTSNEDAYRKALLKRDAIKQKISGGNVADRSTDYEVDIIEEIIAKIDDKNIITRNRYGALVLNSENVMFVDIDTDQFSWRINLFKPFRRFLILFKEVKTPKEETLDFINQRLNKSMFKSLYVRVYETPAGFRLIVLGEDFSARSVISKSTMKLFYADWTYANMCLKQNCYRARLTPKPWRIGIKRHKIVFPFRTEEEELNHQNWVNNYNQKSEEYSACRLIAEHGMPINSKVVKYHDMFCKALTELPSA